MTRTDSNKQILRSTSIIGASTLISMVLGLVRSKIVALILGPTGVGLIGLFNSLLVTATSVGTLGIGTSGVRHIAELRAGADQQEVADARRALLVGLAMLGIFTGLTVWLLRDPLATFMMGDATQGQSVAWMGFGVALGVAATSQNAILNGLRRVGDIARISILSALATTVVGIVIIGTWGRAGIVPYVLVTPLATFLVGHWFVSRLALGNPAAKRPTIAQSLRQCSSLARLGLASLTTLFLMSGALLVVRAQIHTQLGGVALGHFEASWTLLNAYLGAILVAMGTDFYPRLVANLKQPEEACLLVNEQTRLALLLAAPLCLGIIAFAPTILSLLFSSKFVDASSVLRTLVIGDIFKLMSWPLGFVLIAANDARRLIVGELLMVGAMIAVTWFGLSPIGLVAAGIGYGLMYVLYAFIATRWIRQAIGFRWDKRILRDAALLFFFAVAIFAASFVSELLAMVIGGALSLGMGILAVHQIGSLLDGGGKIGALIRRINKRASTIASRG